MEQKALRYNKGKLRFDLIAPEMDLALAKVLTHGCNKYHARNWESGLYAMSYLASCKRHINSWELGEDCDLESNLSHLEHAFTNLGMLITTLKRIPELDDRPSKNKQLCIEH